MFVEVTAKHADGVIQGRALTGQAPEGAVPIESGTTPAAETPEKAALREVKEESSLDVELIGDPAVVVDSTAQRVDVVFRARAADGVDPDAAVAVSPEIVEVGWFAADGLPDLQHEASGAMMALARRRVSPVVD